MIIIMIIIMIMITITSSIIIIIIIIFIVIIMICIFNFTGAWPRGLKADREQTEGEGEQWVEESSGQSALIQWGTRDTKPEDEIRLRG